MLLGVGYLIGAGPLYVRGLAIEEMCSVEKEYTRKLAL